MSIIVTHHEKDSRLGKTAGGCGGGSKGPSGPEGVLVELVGFGQCGTVELPALDGNIQ